MFGRFGARDLCASEARLLHGRKYLHFTCLVGRGELSYLAPLGSENISAAYFKQCFFPDKHHASQSQDRNNKYFISHIEFCINNKI